jgi:hypothetical protein
MSQACSQGEGSPPHLGVLARHLLFKVEDPRVLVAQSGCRRPLVGVDDETLPARAVGKVLSDNVASCTHLTKSMPSNESWFSSGSGGGLAAMPIWNLCATLRWNVADANAVTHMIAHSLSSSLHGRLPVAHSRTTHPKL